MVPSRSKYNPKISRRLSEAIHAQEGDCWRNAIKGLVKVVEWDVPVIYIEGFVFHTGTGGVMLHGWLEVDGALIDPTAPLLGDIENPYIYIVGTTYQAKTVFDLMKLNRPILVPLHVHFGTKEDRHQVFKAEQATGFIPRPFAAKWAGLGMDPEDFLPLETTY